MKCIFSIVLKIMCRSRIILLPVCLIFSLAVTAQSPSLSVNVSMARVNAAGINYQIEMKICTPVKTSERGNWFSPDTSTIDFKSLQAEDIHCGQFLINGEGKEILSGDKTFAKYNVYEFSNQLFAWEQILVFRISTESSAAFRPYMYIILPVRYKSFVTQVDLSGITFQPGKVILLENPAAEYKKSTLHIHQDMKQTDGVEPEELPGLQFIAS